MTSPSNFKPFRSISVSVFRICNINQLQEGHCAVIFEETWAMHFLDWSGKSWPTQITQAWKYSPRWTTQLIHFSEQALTRVCSSRLLNPRRLPVPSILHQIGSLKIETTQTVCLEEQNQEQCFSTASTDLALFLSGGRGQKTHNFSLWCKHKM